MDTPGSSTQKAGSSPKQGAEEFSHPLVLAFELGRSFHRFRWNLAWGCFSGGLVKTATVWDLFDELLEWVAMLAPEDSSDSLLSKLGSIREEVIELAEDPSGRESAEVWPIVMDFDYPRIAHHFAPVFRIGTDIENELKKRLKVSPLDSLAFDLGTALEKMVLPALDRPLLEKLFKARLDATINPEWFEESTGAKWGFNLDKFLGNVPPRSYHLNQLATLCKRLACSVELPESRSKWHEHAFHEKKKVVDLVGKRLIQELKKNKERKRSSTPPAGFSASSDGTVHGHPKNEERDGWIYKRCCEGDEHNEIVGELKKIGPAKRWRPLNSPQAVQQAANRYADRHRLSRPESRRDKSIYPRNINQR